MLRPVGVAESVAVQLAKHLGRKDALALCAQGDTASLVIEERTPLGALRELVVIAILVGISQLDRRSPAGRSMATPSVHSRSRRTRSRSY